MKPTILIVDDFASVRLYHMSFLTRKGYQCLGACDGATALERLAEGPVDLVILDVLMPGMGGDAFVAELDRRPALAALPILAITSEEPLARAMFGPGGRPVDILVKPVMPETLLWHVEKLLPLAPAPASA